MQKNNFAMETVDWFLIFGERVWISGRQGFVFFNLQTEDAYIVNLYSLCFWRMWDELDWYLILITLCIECVLTCLIRNLFDLVTMTGHNLQIARRNYVRIQILHNLRHLIQYLHNDSKRVTDAPATGWGRLKRVTGTAKGCLCWGHLYTVYFDIWSEYL